MKAAFSGNKHVGDYQPFTKSNRKTPIMNWKYKLADMAGFTSICFIGGVIGIDPIMTATGSGSFAIYFLNHANRLLGGEKYITHWPEEKDNSVTEASAESGELRK
ncbi:hypothetical protein JCM33374_g2856 [Metschnikowia sp. JCM 33374]|nr:hypothetical protein JCM33374_g2856 [Metschnikowia sp. JCM 33374]